MKLDAATKMAEQGIEQLAQALQNGRSDTLGTFLAVMAKFHHYSLQNCLMIMSQRPDATHVAGFNKWLQLGRHVKKGEKGIGILAPCVYRKKNDDEDDGPKPVIKGFKVVHVFDVSQTEGEELPQFATVHGDPGDFIERLECAIRQSDIELVYQFIPDGALGCSTDGKTPFVPICPLPNASPYWPTNTATNCCIKANVGTRRPRPFGKPKPRRWPSWFAKPSVLIQ